MCEDKSRFGADKGWPKAMLRLFGGLFNASCRMGVVTLAGCDNLVLVFLEICNGLKVETVEIGCSCMPASENKAVTVVRLDAKLGKTDAEGGKMTLR